MTDAVRRALRTAVQAFLGSIITSGILSTAETDGVVDFSALKKVAVSAAAAAVIAIITWTQNWLEDSKNVPALLKNEKGAVNAATVFFVLAAIAVAVWLVVNFDVVEK